MVVSARVNVAGDVSFGRPFGDLVALQFLLRVVVVHVVLAWMRSFRVAPWVLLDSWAAVGMVVGVDAIIVVMVACTAVLGRVCV